MDREVLGKVMIAYGAVTLVVFLLTLFIFNSLLSMHLPFIDSMRNSISIGLYGSLAVSLVLIFYGIFLIKKKFK